MEITGSSVRVNWDLPHFLDNSNTTPAIDHDRNPGQHFYIGEVFVHYKATDGAGNFNDSCVFKVHVKGMTSATIVFNPIAAKHKKTD